MYLTYQYDLYNERMILLFTSKCNENFKRKVLMDFEAGLFLSKWTNQRVSCLPVPLTNKIDKEILYLIVRNLSVDWTVLVG